MIIVSKIKRLMRNLLSPKAWSFDAGILLLRISCALMLLHGWPKFTNFSEDSTEWPDPFHLGSAVSYTLTVFAELFYTYSTDSSDSIDARHRFHHSQRGAFC